MPLFKVTFLISTNRIAAHFFSEKNFAAASHKTHATLTWGMPCTQGRACVCGFYVDCPARYTAAEVNASAAQWNPSRPEDAALLRHRRNVAAHKCGSMVRTAAAAFRNVGDNNSGTLDTGGWCLIAPAKPVKYTRVELENNQSYYLPRPHVAADSVIVKYLGALLSGCDAHMICRARQGSCPPCNGGVGRYSINDFGAGIGQYGHALLSADPRHRWSGYDGAGNVEEVTDGFVQFFDLTLPLSLPRADWVLSLEVGEHIPRDYEMNYLRNLHAHNCRGMVLSWAYLGKWGVGHVNTHSGAYLLNATAALGYTLDQSATQLLKNSRQRRDRHSGTPNVSAPWSWLRTVAVYRRVTPLTGGGCAP